MRALLRIDNLDVTMARLGCILAVPVSIYLYVEFNPGLTAIGVITFLACLAYLLIKRRKPPSIQSRVGATSRTYLALNALFFCLLAYSIAAYYLRADIYVRPLGYFIATAGMVAILAVEILLLPPKRSAIGFALFKVITISVSLVWTQSLIYPSLVGVDPWYHKWLTSEIVTNGYIPSGQPYSSLPGMHLIIGGTALVTGLSYKMAALCSVSLIQVVFNPVLIFLIGKFLHSIKVGLLAALVLAVANWHILFSYWIIPNGLAIAFIPIIIYLLLKLRWQHPVFAICLTVFFAGAVMLTHTIATIMLVMLLFFIWLGFEVYRRLGNQAVVGTGAFLITALAVVGVAMVFWALVSGDMDTLVGLVGTGFSAEHFGISSLNDGIPVGEQLFNYLGFFLFCGLGFIGIFASFSKGMISRHSFAFTFAGLAILVFTFVCFATHRFIIVGRWCYFLQILLAIPLGVALVWLGNLWRRKTLNACLIGAMVFVLAFLMVMSPQANMDNRTFAPNTIIRSAFTASELEAINKAADMWEGKIAVDLGYYSMRRHFDGRLVDMSPQLLSGNFTDCQDMFILVREEIVVNPCKIGEYAPMRLDYDPREALVQQGFVEVYNSGDVSGFITKVEE